MTQKPQVPVEIKKLEKKEADAVSKYIKESQKALEIIQENHFHFRLYRAVKGDS